MQPMIRITVKILLVIGSLAGMAATHSTYASSGHPVPVSSETALAITESRAGIADSYETLTVQSRVLNETRQIYVQLPTGYEISTTPFPVVYVMDAEWLFHLAAAHVRYYSFDEVTDENIPRAIVVGIPNTDRDRNYTPTPNSGVDRVFPTAGKAADFLRFLEQELIPAVDSRYRTLPGRAIVGWSFSGLFSAYAAVERPGLFTAHLCISPALWWDSDLIFERMRTVKFARPKRMVFTLGSGENGGWVYRSTKRLLRRFEKRPVPGLSVRHFEFEGVGHSWGVASAMDKGLQALFEGYIAPQEVTDGGMGAINAYYEKLSQQWGYSVVPHNRVLIAAANQLSATGKHEAAIEILNTALTNDPNHSMTYYELAAVYNSVDDTDSALRYLNEAMVAEQRKSVPSEVDLRLYSEAAARLSQKTTVE